MKKITSIFLIFIMLLNVTVYAQGENAENDSPFLREADVWAREEVGKALEKRLVSALDIGDLKGATTREEFCILAIKLMEVESGKFSREILAAKGKELPLENTFTDCDTLEVRVAKELGITNGTSATTFSPNDLLTREQAAKFLTATAIACGVDVELTTPDYVDKDDISDWAKPYIGYLAKIGVMKGVGENRFDPKGKYQRQQSIITMYRLEKVIPKVIFTDYEEVENYLSKKPIPEDYDAFFDGTLTEDGKKIPVKFELFLKNDNGPISRGLNYYENGVLMSGAFYSPRFVGKGGRYITYIYDYEYKGKKWRTKKKETYGDNVFLPYLDEGYLNKLKNNEFFKNADAKIVELNGMKVVYVEYKAIIGGGAKLWFDVSRRMPVKAIIYKDDRKMEFKLTSVNDEEIPVSMFMHEMFVDKKEF